MRNTFVRTLIDEARKNRNIELMTGDLGFGVLKPYWEALPDQFTNAGIAEQNMVSAAAGMALTGKTVFVYSIGNFPTLRCVEQIRNDCAYMNADVKIVCVGGGFVYGSLGMSHQATEDIAVLRALPNVTVICPGDSLEAEAAVKAMVRTPGTCYLRLGRGGEKRVHEAVPDFRIGRAIKIRSACEGEGAKIAVFSTGAILDEAGAACSILEQAGCRIEQYSFPTVKPIDCEVIEQCAEDCSLIVTVEEHNIIGGFGSAVAEVMAESDGSARLIRIGVNDLYGEKVGSQTYLRREYGMDADSIVSRIRNSGLL